MLGWRPGSDRARVPFVPMDHTAIKPSSRLQRAAEAERQDLRRQHQRLVASRESILASLRDVERSIAEVEERVGLLAQLAPDQANVHGPGETASRDDDAGE